MSEAEKRLDEILAGLDHVSPGPWSVDFSDYGDECFYGGAGAGYWTIQEIDICTGNHRQPVVRRQADANMAHIARCDPDTIRTIADEFKALKAENARLKAENERLRAAPSGASGEAAPGVKTENDHKTIGEDSFINSLILLIPITLIIVLVEMYFDRPAPSEPPTTPTASHPGEAARATARRRSFAAPSGASGEAAPGVKTEQTARSRP